MAETEDLDLKPLATREELIETLGKILRKLNRRLSNERFRIQKSDDEFLSFVRATTQVAQTLNTILKDDELQEIDKRLTELEAAVGKHGGY